LYKEEDDKPYYTAIVMVTSSKKYLSLESIPHRTLICNIEKNFGDGGKLIKSAGSSALGFAHGSEGLTIKFQVYY
jgi:ribosomal protein L2